MARNKLYATRKLPGLENWAQENGQFEVKWNQEERDLTRSELLEMAKDCDLLITMLSDQIDQEFLKENQHLKGISNYAVGVNNIALNEATRLGIPIGHTPDVLTEATAETALTLLLMTTRKIKMATQWVEQGNWTTWEPTLFNGFSLSKGTLGLIGFGRIGQAFARMCYQLWKIPILVWERASAKDLELDFPYQVVSKEEFYQRVDILSLHCPLTEETENMINESFIEKMEKKFIFINTARGQCHDEKALYQALKQERIRAIGLDVTNPEPMKSNSPLLKRSECIVLPHIGSAIEETRYKMTQMCLENLINACERKPLPYAVVDPFKSAP
jgi:glyoxylate reductase